MTYADAFIDFVIALAPLILAIITVAIIFSWLRVAVDAMSARGW